MFNVPDDWNRYYSRCSTCGQRTHASEHYTCKCDEQEEEEIGRLLRDSYVVCSLSGDIKRVEVTLNAHGGVNEKITYIAMNDYTMRYLTAGQKKYRESLLKRLNK